MRRTMRARFIRRVSPVALALLVLVACSRSDEPSSTQAADADDNNASIAWFDGTVDDALIAAEDRRKPVFLYWGAKWCPPCMQLKTTVFNRPAFIETTRLFVPVYLDGDTPGAQRWGEHFGIVGYPTLIVLRPDGTELTRISSGMDLEAYPRVLKIAARQTRPAEALLTAALAEPDSLAVADWDLLANYGWWVDRGTLLGERSMAEVMSQLAQGAPTAELQDQFALLQYAALLSASDDPETLLTAAQQEQARMLLLRLIEAPARLRANIDTLNYFAVGLVMASAADAERREALAERLDIAMRSVGSADGFTIKDRLYAQRTRVELVKALNPDAPIPAAMIADVRETVAWADQAAETPQERQGMANYATYTLESADLQADAEALLLKEIERSPDAYYFMPTVAEYAQERGDTDQALTWLERAYEESRGPATRAQWGLIYVGGLLDMRPAATDRIEQVMTQIIEELAAEPSAFYQRTRMRFVRIDGELKAWAEREDAQPALQTLNMAMGRVCEQLPEASDIRTDCDALFGGNA